MTDTFRHEAFLYSSEPEFLAGTVPFIRGGLSAEEPVLVVESAERIALLRSALGSDAGRVVFADMAVVGSNPARIIPAWHDFVAENGAGGKRLRGIGEPIWRERSADELVECQRHESLLNVAFAGGQAWSLLCPYDTERLDAGVIAEARRSHEYVSQAGASMLSTDFRGVVASGAPFGAPLPEPAAPPRTIDFDGGTLLALRREVTRFAMSAGMRVAQATELVTSVNEVATNSLLHGGGRGVLRLWRQQGTVVAEVRDGGRYGHPLGDREKPGAGTRDGRGLWLANQLCDLVQIRTLGEGNVVRLQMNLRPPSRLHLVSTD